MKDKLVFWLVLIGFVLVLLYGCGSGGSSSQPQAAAFVVTPFSDTTGRTEVTCPAQTSNTAVLFAFGQSNSANQLQNRYTPNNPKVLNYFQGKCYIAMDPLLGATDNLGSLWTEVGNRLTQFDNVVIIPRGIGGTSIQQWVDNDWMNVPSPYQVTHFLWIQGESDNGGDADKYANNLRQIIYRTKSYSPTAAFYVAIETICLKAADNNIEQAQRSVIAPGVLQGANLDLYGIADRYDGCHLGSEAQAKAIDQWVTILGAK